MKRYHLLAMGSASLMFAAGAAMADPVADIGYGNYTVAAGNPARAAGVCTGAGYTCTTLVAGVGILQQSVNDGAGNSWINTIVVEDDADTGGNNAIVGATYNLGWTNEGFVGVSSGTAGDLGVDSRIALLPQGLNQGPAAVAGNQFAAARISQGGLIQPGDPSNIKITQRQHTGPGANQGTLDFFLMSNGSEADRYMRLDQQTLANNVAGLTVRRSSGSYTETGGTLTLPDGQFLTYNAGDEIGTVWLQLLQFGGAGNPALGNGVRQFQMQSFEVNNDAIAWNTCAAGFQGQCVGVDFGGATWTYWDANFGTAPVTPLAAGGFAAGGAFPNFPD